MVEMVSLDVMMMEQVMEVMIFFMMKMKKQKAKTKKKKRIFLAEIVSLEMTMKIQKAEFQNKREKGQEKKKEMMIVPNSEN